MAPDRSPKRQKVESTDTESEAAQIPLPITPGNNDNDPRQPQRASWYSSWSRKTPSMIQESRESPQPAGVVQADAPSALNTPRPRPLRSPSLAMALGKKKAGRALPIDATTTMVHAEANGSTRKKPEPLEQSTSVMSESTSTKENLSAQVCKGSENKDTDAVETAGSNQHDKVDQSAPSARGSWLGWIGKQDQKPVVEQSSAVSDVSKNAASQTGRSELCHDVSRNGQASQDQDEVQGTTQQQKSVRKSWLPWMNEHTTSGAMESAATHNQDDSIDKKPKSVTTTTQQRNQDKSSASTISTSPPPSLTHDVARPSAWAFWSRERKANDSSTSLDRPHVGEIAVSDTPSQANPKRTSISVPKEANTSPQPPKNEEKKKPQEGSSDLIQSKSESTVVKAESSNASAVIQEPAENKRPASIKSTKTYNNLLLPELQSTLKLPESPSIVQQLTRLLYRTKEPQLKHLSLVRNPPRVKNALAIGIHGYFPAPFIRTVLGQPTGTSIKFADMAAKSIRRWTAARGYECQVKTAALEGEGKIADRVELLWKLLLNWMEEVQKSDFILVACHSQGVPVAIMLVAKLIQFGCVNAARIGICAMAGVNTGPFAEYKSRWISGSAGELFEFSDSSSKVSSDYLTALEIVLKFGVRITYIGSIDDQLVSLESSIFAPISHPHIYRAVSIDARVHAPNFLSHLVGFALKLRNLGVPDHGLIKELSAPLAGSLYTGDGHSRIYESDNCYDLAVDWAMLTTSMPDVAISRQPSSSGSANPYILPFAMRGILEEDFVKNELQGEASELLKQFDEWKPSTKILKDVKFRLEGIRSKL